MAEIPPWPTSTLPYLGSRTHPFCGGTTSTDPKHRRRLYHQTKTDGHLRNESLRKDSKELLGLVLQIKAKPLRSQHCLSVGIPRTFPRVGTAWPTPSKPKRQDDNI